jgi:hypothetical protein
MPQDISHEIFARLNHLERENRRLKRCAAIAIIFTGALLLMAQAPARPRTLEAEKLIIRYPDGKEGIVLEAPAFLGAGAYFSYPNGKQGIALEASPAVGSGAGAYLHAVDGKGGVWMTAFSKESTFHVASPQDNLRMAISADENDAGISAMSAPLTYLYSLSVSANGDVDESLYNTKAGNGEILRLLNGPQGASVRLLDNLETTRAIFGNTALRNNRTGGGETRPLSSLVLFDKDGKVLWRAP